MTKQMIIAAAFAACSAFAQDAPPPPAPEAPSDAPEMQPPLKEGEVTATMLEAGTARGQNGFR
ncbi:hypothetical protein [Akkermansia muciniphila]|uniref:hypothetical protein n=1 Tax=Akkermansia muciniphila TaxID=239935 RepID=UPI000FE173FC|nr:hypothetical protein [Akkermansia muciniphila]QAA60186.1 hypothetical protein C1O57_08580 [Akkermansia muciniphila]QAA62456.1 hypothetical protein C1O59_08235 [Akkermansia muciniphila]QAA64687.1 hypothetical protein C1O60_08250 [Akkermansia muciniphila]QAA66953.1 hypothetical protein C1O61_08360 [Akkermansia muciniphila]